MIYLKTKILKIQIRVPRHNRRKSINMKPVQIVLRFHVSFVSSNIQGYSQHAKFQPTTIHLRATIGPTAKRQFERSYIGMTIVGRCYVLIEYMRATPGHQLPLVFLFVFFFCAFCFLLLGFFSDLFVIKACL